MAPFHTKYDFLFDERSTMNMCSITIYVIFANKIKCIKYDLEYEGSQEDNRTSVIHLAISDYILIFSPEFELSSNILLRKLGHTRTHTHTQTHTHKHTKGNLGHSHSDYCNALQICLIKMYTFILGRGVKCATQIR